MTKRLAALLFLLLPALAFGGQQFKGPHAGVLSSTRTVTAAGGGGGTCGTTISVIQSTGHVRVDGGAVTATFANPVQAGHTIVIGVSGYINNVTNPATVSDSGSNSYSNVVSNTTNNSKIAIHQSAAITTGGSNFSVTVTPDTNGVAMLAMEVEGTSCAGTVTASNSATGSSNSPNSGNISPGVRTLVVGVMSHDNGINSGIAPGGTYTQVYEVEDNQNLQAIGVEYKIVDSGTYSADWTVNDSVNWAAAAAALQ